MPLKIDTTGLDPEYGTDANGNSFINSYYGLTTINGQKVYALTDDQGNLRHAAQINSETNPQFYYQYDSEGKLTGTSQYIDVSKDMGFGGFIKTIAPLALSYFLPGIGAAIASELGVSQAVGTAIAQVASSVAQGKPIDQAILSAGTSLLANGVTNLAGAKDFISTLSTDAATQNIISNAATSLVSTVAKGGSAEDVLRAGLSSVVGTVTGQQLNSEAAGRAVATALATGGDPSKIANSIAGSLGNEATRTSTTTTDQKVSDLTQSSVQSSQASSNLDQVMAQSGLTPEEQEIVRQAKQDVFAQASTAQALPSFTGTATDAPTGIGRLGGAFASNDPRFQAILEKNPSLAKAFDEYTNTYGFFSPAMNVGYIQQLKDELAKDPTNKTFLDEYKKVTGSDYQPAPAVTDFGDLGEIVVTGPRIVASVDPTTSIAVIVDDVGRTTSVSVPPNTTAGSYVNVDPKTNTATVVQPSPLVTGATTATPQGPEVNPVLAPSVSPTTAPIALPSDWNTRDAGQKIDFFNQNNITPTQLVNQGVSPEDIAWMQQNGYVVSPTTAPTVSPTTAPTTAPVTSPVTSPFTDPVVSPVVSPEVSPLVSPVVSPVVSPEVSPLVDPLLDPVLSPVTVPGPTTTEPITTVPTVPPFPPVPPVPPVDPG